MQFIILLDTRELYPLEGFTSIILDTRELYPLDGSHLYSWIPGNCIH